MSIRTLTQEDPIGLAGGLNLYEFAGGDPINFWDPFGLCKDANGNDLPPDQCRSVTATEGQSIYEGAQATGYWVYSRAVHDRGNMIGDCTDYVEEGMLEAGMPSLGTTQNNGATRTGDFAGSNDFVSVTAGDAQAGDIVVQGGHAGVFTGTHSSGFPVVLQNGTRGVQAITFGVNADGTGRNGLAAVQPTFYRRQIPINP